MKINIVLLAVFILAQHSNIYVMDNRLQEQPQEQALQLTDLPNEILFSIIAQGIEDLHLYNAVEFINNLEQTNIQWRAITKDPIVISLLAAKITDPNAELLTFCWIYSRITSKSAAQKIISAFKLAGADINNLDDTGRGPLHYATEEGNIETVRALIAAGANLNLADKKQYTPVTSAIENDRITILQELIDAGAHVSLYDLVKAQVYKNSSYDSDDAFKQLYKNNSVIIDIIIKTLPCCSQIVSNGKQVGKRFQTEKEARHHFLNWWKE